MRVVRLCFVVVLAALTSAGPAVAQGAGAVSGLVSDSEGRPLAGVSVSVGRGPVAVTDSAGRYTVMGLAVGEYEASAYTLGGGRADYYGVVVSAGQTSAVDFSLGPHSDMAVGWWEPPLFSRAPFGSVFIYTDYGFSP